MAVFFVTIYETSILPGNVPMFEDIVRAMRAAGAGVGTWIGSEPRVVRHTDATSLHQFKTIATWPIEIAKPQNNAEDFIADSLDRLDENVQRELIRAGLGDIALPNWSDVYTVPYSPSVNGPMDFWTGGQASNTLTKDKNRWGLNRLTLPEENPYGPNDMRAQDPTPQETATRIAQDIRTGVRAVGDLAREQVSSNLSLLLPFAVVAVGLFLLVELAPAIGTAASAAAAKRRKNPVGRRPRKAPSGDWLDAFALEGATEEDWLIPALLVLPP